MQRKLIINLILLGAIIALSVFLVNTRTVPVNPIVPLTSIAPQSIQTILIKRAGKPDISFRKSNTAWLMTAPLEIRANDNRINAMLQLLRTPSFTRMQAAQQDLARLGLATPAVALQENNHAFLFGTTSPLEGRRYVMINGTIHLIPDGLFPQLQQGATFFVSPRLLPEGTLLQEINLPGHHLSYVNHAWQCDEDSNLKSAALERLAAAWLTATAMSTAILQPAPSQGEIRITTRNGESMRFEILQRQPLLKLARTDLNITYTLPAGSAKSLLKP
jgi:hypothetical protein